MSLLFERSIPLNLRFICTFQDLPPLPFFPPHLGIKHSCDLTAWQQHITVLYNHCMSAQSLWHYQDILSRAQPSIYVWWYSKLGPNLLSPLPSSIYSNLLNDQVCSPQFCALVSHFLPSPSHRIWPFISSSGKISEEKGTLAVGSLGLVLLGFYVSCSAGCQSGPCQVQSFCIYQSDICHVPILPVPFLVRKRNAENKGKKEVIK